RPRILDEIHVEIDGGQVADVLPHDPAEERIAASDLERTFAAAEHFRDELVAGEGESKPLGVVQIGPAGDESEPLQALVAKQIDRFLILDLTLDLLRHVAVAPALDF